jgi:hypothetical protein
MIRYLRLISKIIIFNSTLFLFNFQSAAVWQKVISKAYVTKIRPLIQYNFIFGNVQFFELEDSKDISCFIAPTFATMKNSDFADAFSIDRKNEMILAGDNTPYLRTRDIRAEFVGGNKDTSIAMSLRTTQQIDGIRFLVQIPISSFIKSDCIPNWAFGIRGAFSHIDQALKLNLNGATDSEGKSIRSFFANETDQAKIDGIDRSNNGFEAIAITLEGLYLSEKEKLKIYYYSGVEIPTASVYTTPYLFYPYIGNNGNIALCMGAFFHGYLYQKSCSAFGVLLELEDHFIFYKTSARTFDLYGKPWSRYLPTTNIYQNTSGKTVGSVSTLPVRIHECNSFDGSLGLMYERNDFYGNNLNLSAGYNLWLSQSEYAEYQDRDYKNNYQFFYTFDIKGTEENTISPKTTIKEANVNIPMFVDQNIHFNINDLDPASVCAQGGFSQSVFGRLTLKGETYSIFAGVWDEFGQTRTMPSRYGFWIGFGADW